MKVFKFSQMFAIFLSSWIHQENTQTNSVQRQKFRAQPKYSFGECSEEIHDA